jgi:3-phosphoshikimate 1-carboxyvinyltransferase
VSTSKGETFEIEGGRRLAGTVRVPGDKSISHRAVILAALANGPSLIRGRSDGDDVRRTEDAVRALGANVEGERVNGAGDSLHQPDEVLDFGNSGTGMRLMAGVLASHPWVCKLTGDDSLCERPMDRVASPLRLMGAEVNGRTVRCLPPLVVRGGTLSGIDYTPPMASAQVKSCILLAGLNAEGETVVREEVLTRIHTEELLARSGARISVSEEDGMHVSRVLPGKLTPFELEVPGDPSQTAFWIVAACIVPGSDVVLPGIYTGPARRGFLDVLVRMGASIRETPASSAADLSATSDIEVSSSSLEATEVQAEEIPSLDEVPVLAVAAARAEGTTAFRGLSELRVKESDRFEGVMELVRAFGAEAVADGDDIFVTGVPSLRPAHFDTLGDHRLAMAAAVAAASAEGSSQLTGWSGVRTSYPAFAQDLARLTGREPTGAAGSVSSRSATTGPGAAAPATAAPAIALTRALRVVAIDGPAGAGKSTLAQAVADRLGLDRLDTGAMYRAVAYTALMEGVDLQDEDAVGELARGLDLEVAERVKVNGADATTAIRTPQVDSAVSVVAANPQVRTEMVKRQRAWVEDHDGGVVEGRDIGTVVLPDADLKVYLTASTSERARRRATERGSSDVPEMEAAIERRDRLDSTRLVSPLRSAGDVASDALLIDSTGRDARDVLEEVLSCL